MTTSSNSLIAKHKEVSALINSFGGKEKIIQKIKEKEKHTPLSETEKFLLYLKNPEALKS